MDCKYMVNWWDYARILRQYVQDTQYPRLLVELVEWHELLRPLDSGVGTPTDDYLMVEVV